MAKTVVGLFSTFAEATRVKQALVADGFSSSSINVMANDTEDYTSTASTSSATANESGYTDIGSGGGTGIGEKISSFFRSLTGSDEEDHKDYTSGVSRGVSAGGAMLAVTVDDDEADDVAATLKQHGARDIEEESAGADTNTGAAYASTLPSTGTSTAAEGTAIPIVEEQLVVGKRQVNRGGVRIYSHVVERPVEADVTLRDEFINVERRTVDRAATEADFVAGNVTGMELHATGEEAVVGKTSRVVEEVLVGKESTEHTENISDTVRRTEVEVEQVPGESVKVPTQTY